MESPFLSLIFATLLTAPAPEAVDAQLHHARPAADQLRWDRDPLAFPIGESRAMSAEEQTFYDDLVAGGFVLFDRATHGEQAPTNAVFSPFVVQAAMSTVVAGARGRTAEQLATALAWRLSPATMLAGMGYLEGRLLHQMAEERVADARRSRDWPPFREPRVEDGPRLNLATRLWPDDIFPLRDTFWRAVSESGLSVDAQRLDFQNNPEGARCAINDWTAERTDGLISELLPLNSVQPDVGLVITTALYFQASWQQAFRPLPPKAFTFYPPGRPPVETNGMQVTRHLPILETERFTAVDVPYGNGAFSLLIVQPKGEQNGVLPDITFTLGDYREFFRLSRLTEVDLSMPTFSLRWSSSLKESFQSLGVDLAFEGPEADFTAIYDRNKARKNLYIDDIFKEAFIEVTPEGTRAGAATAVVMALFGCARLSSPLPVRIDQPFLFVLHDRETRTPLFLGRLIDPAVGP